MRLIISNLVTHNIFLFLCPQVNIPEYRIELWPGFVTSVRQHEHNVLVCCEVSHKIMRQDTVYDLLREFKGDAFKKEVIGSIVLTDYNNKVRTSKIFARPFASTSNYFQTYRVDDVDFEATPLSTFDQKGTQVTYADYYLNRYNIVIRDKKQPMLVSNPKARDKRDGRNQLIYLIPELCRATGLTDKMRSNFQLMRSMAGHTQMDPERRKARLLTLSRRLHNSGESVAAFEKFHTDISQDLVKFTGRQLKQETMVFGNDRT